jgi:hypothetical protein
MGPEGTPCWVEYHVRHGPRPLPLGSLSSASHSSIRDAEKTTLPSLPWSTAPGRSPSPQLHKGSGRRQDGDSLFLAFLIIYYLRDTSGEERVPPLKCTSLPSRRWCEVKGALRRNCACASLNCAAVFSCEIPACRANRIASFFSVYRPHVHLFSICSYFFASIFLFTYAAYSIPATYYLGQILLEYLYLSGCFQFSVCC